MATPRKVIEKLHRTLAAAPDPHEPASKSFDARRADYHREVRELAEWLKPRFLASEFNNMARSKEIDADEPFWALEQFCASHPLCEGDVSARWVLAVSKYAKEVTKDTTNREAMPRIDDIWSEFSGWCLARDLHDEAIRRGWAKSVNERIDSHRLEDDPEEVEAPAAAQANEWVTFPIRLRASVLPVLRAIVAASTAGNPEKGSPYTEAEILEYALIEGLIAEEKETLGTRSLDGSIRPGEEEDDYPKSTPVMDALVQALSAKAGV